MRFEAIWLSTFVFIHCYIVDAGLSGDELHGAASRYGCSSGSAMLQATFSSRQGDPLALAQEESFLEVQPAAAEKLDIVQGLFEHVDLHVPSPLDPDAAQS